VPDEPRVDLDIVVRGGMITGTVIDGEDRPLRGASVLATAEGGDSPGTTGVVSDAEGRFQIDGLEDGTYRVTASAPGYRIATVHPVAIGADAPAPLELRLVRGDALRGRVVDGRGQGLPGAMVLVAPSGSTHLATAISGQTDVNGSFRVTAPVDGPLDVTAVAAGWAPAVLRGVLPATGPDATESVLHASMGGRLRVRVSGPEGQPLPSVQVELRAVPPFLGGEMALLMNPPPLTDAAGVAIVERLAPGAYRVAVAGAPQGAPAGATVVEGSETTLEIRLP
jgi:hypothetical protein